jgi:hypothetical protein
MALESRQREILKSKYLLEGGKMTKESVGTAKGEAHGADAGM